MIKFVFKRSFHTTYRPYNHLPKLIIVKIHGSPKTKHHKKLFIKTTCIVNIYIPTCYTIKVNAHLIIISLEVKKSHKTKTYSRLILYLEQRNLYYQQIKYSLCTCNMFKKDGKKQGIETLNTSSTY
jgi:hypothetical protein